MSTIQEFVAKHGIVMDCVRVPNNPQMPVDTSDKNSVKWNKEAGHFMCSIVRNDNPNFHPSDRGVLPSFNTYYSMGSGHRKPVKNGFPPSQTAIYNPKDKKFYDFPLPKVEDVLDCLASDACEYEGSRDFEDWASEYGYDTDSRKAESIYRIVSEQAKQLRQFLGRDAFRELIEDTERL